MQMNGTFIQPTCTPQRAVKIEIGVYIDLLLDWMTIYFHIIFIQNVQEN